MISLNELEILVKNGAPYSQYPCNQLVHCALTGNKNGHLAKDSLTRGREVTSPQEGDVVVGKDGKHCGIFVDSTHFIHAIVLANKKQSN